MNAAEIAHHLHGRRSGGGYVAQCPAHEDHSPSLSLTDSSDGKVLAHCHAGCEQGAVVDALKDRGLWPESNGHSHSRTIIAEYDYRDERGQLLFQAVRFDPKDFRQRQPDDRGGWIWNLHGVRLVLYRLPELLRHSDEKVFVCEGEKDVAAIESLGLLGTCNPMGAGKWRLEYSETLRGRSVVILPDGDTPGRRHALAVAESLLRMAHEVRIIEVPRGKDVSDWKADGGNRDELRELFLCAPILDAAGLAELRTKWNLAEDAARPRVESAEETEPESAPRVVPWPDPMRPEAFHGIAGELARMIEPHSEADPVALLTHALVAFGNAVGRGPHFRVGGAEHHPSLYCVNVGATASRKGTGKEDIFFVIRSVDPNWFDNRIQSGLSSGEGFIWAVRDQIEEQQPVKDKGRVVDYQTVMTDPGVKDKRLLIVEAELGSTLRVLERDGNTLSAQLRQAWDSGSLRILTKNKAAHATSAHVSILAHITREELLKYLAQTEQANGFANRFLWVCVRRYKLLPEGGELHRLQFDHITQGLRAAVEFARTVGEVRRSEAAREIWHSVYAGLAGDRAGLFGAVTGRAEAQTMRLAMVYALLDRSAVIEPEHLNAALALWSYCEQSARFIFGDSLGDATADEILRALRSHSYGMARTHLSHLFGRNKSAAEIERALARLTESGKVMAEQVPSDGPGRPTEIWRAVWSTK